MTDITLREHIEALLAERDLRYGQRFDDMDTATRAALAAVKEDNVRREAALEKRFDGVNEFRGTLSDQATKFIPRTESEATTDRLDERMRELGTRVNLNQGRILGLVAAGGLIATVAAIVIPILTR